MRWPSADERRWMLKGAGIMLGLGLVVGLCVGGWVVYLRSLHGQQAYEYLQQVIAAQQAQQKAPVPAAKP